VETLLTIVAKAPSWVEATRCPATSFFQSPYMGSPWHHNCAIVSSSGKTALSVVIPCWNSVETVKMCLNAISRSSFNRAYPSKLEVIVCDDGSDDGTAAAASVCHKELDLKIIQLHRGGRALAVNAGIESAAGDVVVVCDSDMILGCGALDELLVRHEQWPDAVCFGFRSDVILSPTSINDDRLYKLMHSEAVSHDNRLSFDTPSLLHNPLVSTEWLAALSQGRTLLDSRGIVWRRHRFLYGCLFSAKRDFLMASGNIPTVFSGWGYEDTFFAALAEAHGGFLLPVLSAWAHHIRHDIRDPDQWFQYDRNRLAYEFLLDDPNAVPPNHAQPDIADCQSKKIGLSLIHEDHKDCLPVTAQLMHRLGRWREAAERITDGTMSLSETSECLFQLHRFEEAMSLAEDQPTYWTALSLLALGRLKDAGRALETATDQASRYLRSASKPELQALQRHLDWQGLDSLARIFEAALQLHEAWST